MPHDSLTRALARALSVGEADQQLILERASRALGRKWPWLKPLARRYVRAMQGQVRPRLRDVLAWLQQDPAWDRFLVQRDPYLRVVRWLTEVPRMDPAPAARGWAVPAIETLGDLARWLEVDPGELDWFADTKGWGRKPGAERLRHYRYQTATKPDGRIRVLEAPKPRLKAIQRRILHEILDRVPVHGAVHGFVRGRSIVSFVGPHARRDVLLRVDLQDFFPSISKARVAALFRTIGYPEPVADMLAGLCTNRAPRTVAGLTGTARIMYWHSHLPQGAPTSPALANLCAYGADCRLSGLAESAGVRYTRYADDLAFSGGAEFARTAGRFAVHAAAILLEEGFLVNHRKTRVMRRGGRQHLAGLTMNERANVPREEFDRLKATLTNCVRQGPESQNRAGHPSFRQHLEGRVGFVEMVNPARGAKLRRLLLRVEWPE